MRVNEGSEGHLGTISGPVLEVDSGVDSEVILDPYLDPSEKPHHFTEFDFIRPWVGP